MVKQKQKFGQKKFTDRKMDGQKCRVKGCNTEQQQLFNI